ncbi:hypothetical protein GUJ93_ZPchr0012g19583 [Zizania palustris]|uniref:Uncharacterized protein n=1 Tax=Zizania palustris TaxID=103762 RepID=A0A8J5WPC8_ZIZPA|nr:hypothetical protein GUJ93_ZPchr0012g19583 [Zizania palustris]
MASSSKPNTSSTARLKSLLRLSPPAPRRPRPFTETKKRGAARVATPKSCDSVEAEIPTQIPQSGASATQRIKENIGASRSEAAFS